MVRKIPSYELQDRMNRFRSRMDRDNPKWELAILFSKVNQYYFTGTMQDGMLVVPRDDEAVYWVRRSYERARDESLFPNIRPMKSYRDAAVAMGSCPTTLYTEMEVLPLAMFQRLQKYFSFRDAKPADAQIMTVRAVKSDFEITIMKRIGEKHRHILETVVPEMLNEGMSESDLASSLFNYMIKEGHHGFARFGMFDTNIGIGQLGFGESSLYPTYFDGPGGNYGMSPAMPFWGSRERKLKKGDLVFVDVAFGLDGYHTDKTMNYMFGMPIKEEAIVEHNKCVEVQRRLSSMLKRGNTPSNIYREIMDSLSPEFLNDFMGYGDRKVKFLGHGIGLQIDEAPVIAAGFDEPLEEGMVIALEPKKGISGIGLVGTENTYLVTPEGGQSITGNDPGLILV
jgi:Xaa-Pro dipeptidase